MALKHLLSGPDSSRTVVFSGGRCNVANASGKMVRSTGRDELNAWLDGREINFFDPQIEESTHGRSYDYDIDGPAEQAARAAARVTVYEIGPDTMAGVTHLEALNDAATGKKVVVWFNGGLDEKGRPSFVPEGAPASDNALVATHLAQYTKNGTALRRNLRDFLKAFPNAVVVTSLEDVQNAINNALNS